MRGLALATLFIGLCLINTDNDDAHAVLIVGRIFVFVGAMFLIGLGA